MIEPGNEAQRLLSIVDEDARDFHWSGALVELQKAKVLASLQVARELRTIAETLDALLDEAKRANE